MSDAKLLCVYRERREREDRERIERERAGRAKAERERRDKEAEQAQYMRERERQRREILDESKAAADAVELHFKESLRLASQKVRTKHS